VPTADDLIIRQIALEIFGDCDQLYEAPERLVWSDIPGKEYGQSKFLQDLDFRRWPAEHR
jgi:hypothetical protein